ncbi:alpha/beta hydrolase family protein [Sporosalibacterium faouarense]|uniref:alpha/beta hydrolase family protein n=1 Tax=Sporosalibacterium faouarense TaxID=516123 RepID=UPI00192CCA11|nr:S9 family peptidase [Sporosalibacterium faouarense]
MKNLELDEFIKYKFISGIKYSPDGEKACFVVHQSDVNENKYQSNLWIYSLKENKYFQLTAYGEERSFIWLEDSEHIIFSGLRDEKEKEKKKEGEEYTQYYRINIHGGEANKYFKIPKNVNSIKSIDSNTFVFTSTYNPYKKELNKLSEEEKKEELKKRKEEKDYEVIDEIPFWHNGGSFSNKDRNRLYKYNLENDSVEAITDEYTDVETYNLNVDKTKISFISQRFKAKMELNNDICMYDINDKKISKISPYDNFNYGYVNFIDTDNLIFTGKDMKRFGLNENNKFYILRLQDNHSKCITPDFDYSIWNSVGSDCRYGSSQDMKVENNHLYFVTTEGFNSYINKLNINGEIQRIIAGKGSIDGFDISSGDLMFIGLRGLNLQEIYRLKDNKEIKITDFNNWVQKERTLIEPERITVETEPGVSIDGWIMKPVNFEEGKKYPAILDIHGGPKTVYGEVFYHEMQYWANQGYVVFFCNPRGSDGKGDEFADIRGKYGTIDYEDIMMFTDEVMDRYSFIDKDRVGVTGGSYGGFMTNWIIGHTDKFKAAVSQRSISNWVSMFGTTDIGYYFAGDQNASTPWDSHDNMWEQSPLKYADQVTTPTLFIHSEEDYRCWIVEGIQMFTALKYHGVESRMCIFKGENHELSRSGKPKHRIRRLKEITEWFDSYLKS